MNPLVTVLGISLTGLLAIKLIERSDGRTTRKKIQAFVEEQRSLGRSVTVVEE